MMRGGKFVGSRKAPHILFRNGLWRCYTLVWGGKYSNGLRLGLGHTLDAAYNRWLDRRVMSIDGFHETREYPGCTCERCTALRGLSFPKSWILLALLKRIRK